MFIGHYAPALLVAADRRAPSLGKLFVAAQLVDFFFFGFAIIGVEQFRLVPGVTAISALYLTYAPYTHSLLGTLGFAAAWAIATRLLGGGWPAAWLGAAVVASHWLLDLLVHAPDLTLAGVGYRYGLALWNHPFIAMPLELALVAVAFTYYVTSTRNRSGGWGSTAAVVSLLAAMLFVQFVEWLGPKPAGVVDPPPLSLSLNALAVYTALACLAAWVAQVREVR